MVETLHSCTLCGRSQEVVILQKKSEIAQMSMFGQFFLQNAIYFKFYLVILQPIR